MNVHLFVACWVENTLQLLVKLKQLGVKRSRTSSSTFFNCIGLYLCGTAFILSMWTFLHFSISQSLSYFVR